MGRLYIAILVVGGTLGCSTGPAKSAGAKEVLEQNQTAIFALQAYRARCRTTLSFDRTDKSPRYEVAFLTAEKPTKMRYDNWELKTAANDVRPTTEPNLTFASNGHKFSQQFGKVYRVSSPEPDRMNTILEPWGGFYSKENSILGLLEDEKRNGGTYELSSGRSENVDGIPCDLVIVHASGNYEGDTVEDNQKYWIGKDDHLVRKMVDHTVFGGSPGITREAVLDQIETSPKVEATLYDYVPPRGVAPEEDQNQPELLPNGDAAPNFSALSSAKEKVNLRDLRGKVVVVDFWASWCGPCRESMPHTQEVIAKLTREGLPVIALAVDDGEPWQGFADWVGANGSTYSSLRFVHSDPSAGVSSKLYRVSGIPTQYVIDQQGKIRASFVGYGGPTDDLESAVRAALKS